MLVNDRFSPNVGDGVIAECMDFAIRRTNANVALAPVDIDLQAGRPAADQGPSAALQHALRVSLDFAPEPVKTILRDTRSACLTVPRIRAAGLDVLRDASAVVFGGGHLINGSTPYFAERLAAFSDAARMLGVPRIIYSVGVSDPSTWDRRAREFFLKAFSDCRALNFVSTRDPLSSRYWEQAFGGRPPPVHRDPALLSAETYAPAIARAMAARRGARPRIGVGVIAASTVRLHGARGTVTDARAELFRDLALEAVRMGGTPVLFTNGDPSDSTLLHTTRHLVLTAAPRLVSVLECVRPTTPMQLVSLVAGLDALVAHRLHANVVAYSLMVPHVGLGWDEKLVSFFESVARPQYVVAEARPAASAVMALVRRALDHAVSELEHRAVLDEARSSVADLVERVTSLARIPQRAQTAGFQWRRIYPGSRP